MEIVTKQDYEAAFARIDALVEEGFEGNAAKEAEYRQIAEAIQAYEQLHYHFPKPNTLVGMIELKMFEQKLKQKDLAELLDLETSRVSELLNGKRKLTLKVAQKLYRKLGIPADFILETA